MGWLDSIRERALTDALQGATSTEPFTAPLYLNSSGRPTWKSPYFLDPVTEQPVAWDAVKAEHPEWAPLIDGRSQLLIGSAAVEKWTVATYGPEYSSGDQFHFGPDGRTIKNDPFPWAMAAIAAIPIAAPFLAPIVGGIQGVAGITGAAGTTIQRATARPIEAPPIIQTLQAQADAEAAQRAAQPAVSAAGLLDLLNDPTVQIALIGVVIIAVLAARK